MTQKKKNTEYCDFGKTSKGMKCCKVDSVITIDGRGQIVLPKDVREKAKIKAGDKFAVISCESDGKVYCIALVKAEAFAGTVKGMLGPVM
ncbi:MAG: HgcAB-associated protein [Candidatus Bathyarchaeota archaeon]